MNEYQTALVCTLLGKRPGKEFPHYEWAVAMSRPTETRVLTLKMGLAHEQTKCGKHAWSRDYRGRLPEPPCHHERCRTAGPQR